MTRFAACMRSNGLPGFPDPQAGGVGVVVEAEHTCGTLRGVHATGSRTLTSTMPGTLRGDVRSRAAFLTLTGLSG